MSGTRALLIAAGTFALGVVLCHVASRVDHVDPNLVIHKVLACQTSCNYHAIEACTCQYFGRQVDSREEVDSSFSKTCSSAGLPGATSWVVLGRRDRISLIEKNYSPCIEGEDSIAHREAWVLRLKPREKHRPWKQIWVDRKTSAVLASRDWSHRNTVKASMKTFFITFRSALLPCRQHPAPSVNQAAALAGASHALGKTVELPRYIPSGYELADLSVDGRSKRSQIVYTDGLDLISVFVQFSDRKGREHGTMGHVRDWGQGLELMRTAGNHSVVVMADLPASELKRIAASVQ